MRQQGLKGHYATPALALSVYIPDFILLTCYVICRTENPNSWNSFMLALAIQMTLMGSIIAVHFHEFPGRYLAVAMAVEETCKLYLTKAILHRYFTLIKAPGDIICIFLTFVPPMVSYPTHLLFISHPVFHGKCCICAMLLQIW